MKSCLICTIVHFSTIYPLRPTDDHRSHFHQKFVAEEREAKGYRRRGHASPCVPAEYDPGKKRSLVCCEIVLRMWNRFENRPLFVESCTKCVCFRYTEVSDNLLAQKQSLDSLLDHRATHGHDLSPRYSLLSHLPEMSTSTLQDQLAVLCSIPNYHWWNYKLEGGATKAVGTKVRYLQHLLFHPCMKRMSSGALTQQHLPVSPRNSIILFFLNNKKDRLSTTVQYCLYRDRTNTVEHVVRAPGGGMMMSQCHHPEPKGGLLQDC